MNLPIRFAIIGARRGKTFINSAQKYAENIKVVAICDLSDEKLDPWRGTEGIRLYKDYQKVLEDPEIDAVCLATPVYLHARQAIAALEAGKHVLSEVTACYDLDEGHQLIETVERTGLTYMMAENYCFMRDNMMVLNMVEQGVFGEITFAEGSYIHDCRDLSFSENGDLTWRGDVRRTRTGNTYPTHSIGPICRWLGINKTDFLKTTATWQSPSLATAHYAQRNLPQKTEYANGAFWKHPDSTSTLIRTEKGVLINSRLDYASARPHNMTFYGLQGTKAAFASEVDPDEGSLIWIEGRSPMSKTGIAESWEPLHNYAKEFEHPLWRTHFEEAQNAGHGGGDFFVLREFVSAVIEQRPPLIDVYDAVTWSAITGLSVHSIEQGNMPVEVPRFVRK